MLVALELVLALTTSSFAKGSVAFDQAVELCQSGGSFSRVPGLLTRAFDMDEAEILQRSKSVRRVPCRRPVKAESGYGRFDEDLLTLCTESGDRICKNGRCCEVCSRVVMPDLATTSECNIVRRRVESILPGLEHGPDATLNLIDAAFVAGPKACVRSTLLMIRLVERLRRAIAHEYKIPLSCIAPDAAFVSRIAACDGRRSIHADESSNPAYHYSAVLYLTSQGEHFTGGDFVFVDETETQHDAEESFPWARTLWPFGTRPSASSLESRSLTRIGPRQGEASFFSSGWENVHFVDAVSSGQRFAMPAFFTTSESEKVRPQHQMGPDVAAAAIKELCLHVDCNDGELDSLKDQWHMLFAPGR